MGNYNLVELFSGIGSQHKALKNLGVKVNTLGTCEWDVHAIVAYDLIHNNPADISDEVMSLSKGELLEKLKDSTFSNSGKTPLDYKSLKTYSLETLQRIYASITRNHNFVDIRSLKGDAMPANIDILTYSFPCQDLSNVGAFHGYNKGIDKDSGSRSSLLWQVGRILTEMSEADISLPRYLLMENVPTLLSKRHFPNFRIWIDDLERLGYLSKYFQLNASSFGLPQNRPRLLMISVYAGQNDDERRLIKAYFNMKNEEAIIQDYQNSKFFHDIRISELLRIDYSNRALFHEALESTPKDTASRKKIWDNNPQIVLPGNELNKSIQCIRTITTKQDRNPNSGNLYFEPKIEGFGNFRYLTPRECLLFMGFSDLDFERLQNNKLDFHKGDGLFSRDKIVRMAGNSIPVKLLEGIFLQILQMDDMLHEYRNYCHMHHADLSQMKRYKASIRSYLFSRGIHSRSSPVHYLSNADIVYSKYKTAVYIYNRFVHTFPPSNALMQKYESSGWICALDKIYQEDMEEQTVATKNGWNTLVLYEDDFDGLTRDETFKWIEEHIRANTKSAGETGKVITHG